MKFRMQRFWVDKDSQVLKIKEIYHGDDKGLFWISTNEAEGVCINKNELKEVRDNLNELLGDEKAENHALYESLCRENLNLRKQLTQMTEVNIKKIKPEIVYLVNKDDISKETNAKLDKLEKESKDAEYLRERNERIMDMMRDKNKELTSEIDRMRVYLMEYKTKINEVKEIINDDE